MDKEIAVYGMTREDIEEFYINSITAKLSGLEMVVAGILSDCQELAGNTEQVRKQLNVAKFILFKMMEEDDVRAQYRKKVASLKDIPKNYGKETV
jgi:hypothetical protein